MKLLKVLILTYAKLYQLKFLYMQFLALLVKLDMYVEVRISYPFYI